MNTQKTNTRRQRKKEKEVSKCDGVSAAILLTVTVLSPSEVVLGKGPLKG